LETIMAEIHLAVSDDFMTPLLDATDGSIKSVVSDALAVFSWVVEERKAGRIIISCEKNGAQVARLTTPTNIRKD